MNVPSLGPVAFDFAQLALSLGTVSQRVFLRLLSEATKFRWRQTSLLYFQCQRYRWGSSLSLAITLDRILSSFSWRPPEADRLKIKRKNPLVMWKKWTVSNSWLSIRPIIYIYIHIYIHSHVYVIASRDGIWLPWSFIMGITIRVKRGTRAAALWCRYMEIEIRVCIYIYTHYKSYSIITYSLFILFIILYSILIHSIMLYHIISSYIIWYHIILYHTILYHIILYYVEILHCIIIIWYYIILKMCIILNCILFDFISFKFIMYNHIYVCIISYIISYVLNIIHHIFYVIYIYYIIYYIL